MRRAPLLAALVLCVSGGVAGSAARAAGEMQMATREIVPKAPECAVLFKGGADKTKPNLWESAKQPALGDHCALLQKGVQRINEGNFVAALDLAQKADDLTPGQPGPFVVRGSAYARWGKPKDALEAFEKAKARHARALDDATILDDYGSVLLRLGKVDEARRAYRALLPRVTGPTGMCGVQTSCAAASLAYLTAGVLAMEEGPSGLEEAAAILKETRAKAIGDLQRVASLAFALALDRAGEAAQAREIAAEVVKTKGVPNEIAPEIAARFASMEEGWAMRAIGLEVAEPLAASDAWKAYLAAGGDKRAWAAHARAHLARLEKGAKPEKGGKPAVWPKDAKDQPTKPAAKPQ